MRKLGSLLPDATDLVSLRERLTQFVNVLGLHGMGGQPPVPCNNQACGRPLQAKVVFCPYCGAMQPKDPQGEIPEKVAARDSAPPEAHAGEAPSGQWLKRVWPFSSNKKP